MVEITRREKTEEELKVIEEARKASGKWMGEEKIEDIEKNFSNILHKLNYETKYNHKNES